MYRIFVNYHIYPKYSDKLSTDQTSKYLIGLFHYLLISKLEGLSLGLGKYHTKFKLPSIKGIHFMTSKKCGHLSIQI